MIQYREIPFSDPESAFECAWEMTCSGDGTIQRIVPDGRAELITQMGECPEQLIDGEWIKQRPTLIAGQITRPLFLRLARGTRTRGMRFRPWSLGSLIKDAKTATDNIVKPPLELQSLIGSLSIQEIDEISSPKAEPSTLRSAIVHAETLKGNCDVERIAGWSHLGPRQLERTFLRDVGITPKLYLRILRFRSVFQDIDERFDPNWVAIAADRGYADQSHLTKDFQRFAGCAPGHSLTPEAAITMQFTAIRR